MKKLEQTLTSLEVAGMVGKEHKNLIRDVRSYAEELRELKIEPSEFFKDNTYLKRGKEYPCFDVTKKGCEFIAHKLTGIRVEFYALKLIGNF
ncbi:MAG: phage regulatory protein, rha family [Firmicutes bacterium]|nr:phage regulatory protein, rha family [Bacillota bacterium]